MDDCNIDNIFNLFLASCLECVGNRKKEGQYERERERDAEMKRERESLEGDTGRKREREIEGE